MDAMILAAGLGTRLRPITDALPKALVEVGGVPMLERVARRLAAAGVDRLVVNAHHHADRIRRFIDERDGFGMDVRISEEPDAPLETGGGLKRAAPHFRADAAFFLHNVDVVTEIPLKRLYLAHAESGALATLAVSARPSPRRLRFDARGLQGHVNETTGAVVEARPADGETRDWAFTGVHVLSPDIFDLMDESGTFSIIEPYMRLAGAGHEILPFDIGSALWLEVGTPERLRHARRMMAGPPGSETEEAEVEV